MTAGGRLPVVAVVATGAVVAAVVVGLLVIGSPGAERERRLDDRRATDLQNIARAVDLYLTREGRLPVSLDELNVLAGTQVTLRDPETEQPYEYEPVGPASRASYELCARFLRPSDDGPPPSRQEDRFWTHGAGRQCFELEGHEVAPFREP